MSRDPATAAMKLKPGGQHERVLRASRSYQGVCQSDMLAPNVCDGGNPITRVPARIEDLEQRGCTFEVVGWRGSTKVYRLVSAPGVERGVSGPMVPPAGQTAGPSGHASLGQDTLFGQPRRKGKHGFADQEAA